MLKNKFIIFSIVWPIILYGIFSFFHPRFQLWNDTLFFEYPSWDINFSGEKVPLYGINMSVKERFDKEFLNTSNNLYQFFLYVKRFPLYSEFIETSLKTAGIPSDFIYLPIAESALKNDIVSSAGAAGIWQFMPDTARNYGLRVDEFIDERYHFEKSTLAAMEYLKKIHGDLGNWTLTAAAYNRGENGLMRDMEEQAVSNYYDLYLNEETSRYIFRILAIKYSFESYFQRKAVIDNLIGGVYSPAKTKNISVGKIENLMKWSQENGFVYQEVRNLNPWILWNQLPEGNWEVSVNAQ